MQCCIDALGAKTYVLQNKAVILVDDIVTSGATMRRCVDALTSQGALVITVLALAHTPAGRPLAA